MRQDFAVFIITHGRPNNQKTLNLLTSFGYSGKIFLVIDDEDETANEYKSKYGDKIIQFSKEKYVVRTDTGLHEPFKKFAVFARNAVEDIAQYLRLSYFMVLDDDIVNLRIRYDDGGSLKSKKLIGIIDEVFTICLSFMYHANIHCTSFGFCNVYRSGVKCLYKENPRIRLCAAAFIRDTQVRVDWRLNMVEDLITSIDYNRRGMPWLQILPIQVDVVMSEGEVAGGNSDAYNNFGKYRMSFMPTIVYPDCNVVTFHHNNWHTTLSAENSVPKIIGQRYKKECE